MVSQQNNTNLFGDRVPEIIKTTAGDYIDMFFLNYFYGGNSIVPFAPSTDQWVFIDDVHIFWYKPTEQQPLPHSPSAPDRKLTKIPGWNYTTGEKVERTTDH